MCEGPWLSDLRVRLCFVLAELGGAFPRTELTEGCPSLGQTVGSDFLRETLSCQCL